MCVVHDGAREKTDSFITLFFVCCLWWGKRKKSFCYNLIFTMLSMMDQVKKVILFKHYFLYVVYDGETEKIHFVLVLFFFMLSIMEQEKELILLERYFWHFFYDGAREKTHSVITLFFLCCLWLRKRENSFSYHIIFVSYLWYSNSKSLFCCKIILFMFSMMEHEKKLIL